MLNSPNVNANVYGHIFMLHSHFSAHQSEYNRMATGSGKREQKFILVVGICLFAHSHCLHMQREREKDFYFALVYTSYTLAKAIQFNI